MRSTFLKWLFIFVLGAFVLVAVSSFLLQTANTNQNTEELFRMRIADAIRQIKQSNENVDKIKEITTKSALAKAYAFAEIVKDSPEILESEKSLKELAKKLDVDELHVSDDKGILIASLPARYKGYDMNSAEQSKEFMPALTDKNFSLVQPIRKNGAKEEFFQYAGVARLDQPGIIQIGYRPKRLIEAIRLADISNFDNNFRIGTDGFLQIAYDNKYILNSKPIPHIAPKDLALNDMFSTSINGIHYSAYAEKHKSYTLLALLPLREMFANRWDMLIMFVAANLLVFIFIYFLVSTLLQNLVISGIYKVNSSLSKITAGDLEETVQVHNTKEFSDLSNDINTMVSSLKTAHAETKKKIETELSAARAIQLSALPTKFPPFPDRNEFEIYAATMPAKEVGGDFYDFFMINEDELAFLVADVAGKGIPAALFMMKTKAIIKDQLLAGVSPAKAFINANSMLCENNSVGMFVTAFLCILKISSGKLTCINAGHNPPLLKRASGKFQYLKVDPSFVLGGLGDSLFHTTEIELHPHDRLFLYTDGITEAKNLMQQLYGEGRLQRLLDEAAAKDIPLDKVPEFLKNDIKSFTNDEEQSDDITMLIFDYFGEPKDVHNLELNADRKELPAVVHFFADKLSYIDHELLNKIQVAVEEIFVNIASYAYPEKMALKKNGRVYIRLEASASRITITFTDTGIPYNPLEAPAPDITLPASQRRIGGLGIYMVRQLMDLVDYQNRNGLNILTMKKNL